MGVDDAVVSSRRFFEQVKRRELVKIDYWYRVIIGAHLVML